MDFGIARADAPTGETDAAHIVGTPEYMAPEQARGLKVDGRADLYALGCVLYRMLGGQVPFPAPTRVAAMARHLSDAPPDVRKVRPEVPAWLARLTLELMAKDADARPTDAATVSARLAGPPSRWRPATVLTVLAPLVILTLVVGALAAWRQHRRASWQPSLHQVAAESDEESLTFDLSPDGKSIAFDARRNGVWRVYAGPVEGSAHAITPDGYSLFNWAADGRALFVHDDQFSTYRVDTADGRLELVGRDIETITDCGRFGLITVESRTDVCPWCNTLVVRRPDGTREVLRTADPDVLVRNRIICDAATGRVAYSAIRSVTTGKRVHDFWLHSLATTPAQPGTRLLEGVGPIMPGPFAGPDTLVVVNWDGDAEHLWELRTDGRGRRQLTFAGRDVHPVLAGDKRSLWFENSQSHLTLFSQDVASGRAQRLTFGNDYVFAVVPSRDGRSVAMLFAAGPTSRWCCTASTVGPIRPSPSARAWR